MNQRVDYHTHTYYSDGRDSPTDLVKWAKNKGLSTIAITDHDGVGGIKEGQIAGNALDITVIAGIEFSTLAQEGMGLHLLGYNIDVENKELIRTCEDIRVNRNKRNQKYLKALSEEGFMLTEEDLLLRPNQDFIGKPTIARAMVRKGYIKDPLEAFEKIFSKEKLRKIKKDKIADIDAIKIILNAGGIPALAHPGIIRGLGERGSEDFYKNLDALVKRLKKAGLKGMECYYPSHNEEETLRFVSIAEKYHLHITTGSDYHGEDFSKGAVKKNYG